MNKIMTKEAKQILKKDLKKYIKLAEIASEEEDQKEYRKIANLIDEILN